MSFTVEVKGINDVVKRIQKLGDEVAKDADKAMGYSIRAIERDAKNNAPSDSGDLKSRVAFDNTFLDKEVRFLAPYAPYVEFGTKSKVDVPPGLEKYAMQFKGKGSSTLSTEEIKENIYRWARMKGIPKDKWWLVYISIMVNGIKAQPFLYPASRREFPKLKKKLEAIVNERR